MQAHIMVQGCLLEFVNYLMVRVWFGCWLKRMVHDEGIFFIKPSPGQKLHMVAVHNAEYKDMLFLQTLFQAHQEKLGQLFSNMWEVGLQ